MEEEEGKEAELRDPHGEGGVVLEMMGRHSKQLCSLDHRASAKLPLPLWSVR